MNTKNGYNTFTLLKYDPEPKSTISETGSKRSSEDLDIPCDYNGFEVVNEKGIFRLDDGYYAECEYNDYDEIECHDVNRIGHLRTMEGEIISCRRKEEDDDDKGKIVCIQATEGGYYIIDHEFLECNPSEEGASLECKKVRKEGYFLSSPEDILYECHQSIDPIMEPDETTETTETTEIEDSEKETGEINDTMEFEEDDDDQSSTNSITSTFILTTTTTTSEIDESITFKIEEEKEE